MNLAYSHVDVFSQSPFGGNSLPVFPDARDLSAEQMLRITQQMRHFEAIFLKNRQASLPLSVPGSSTCSTNCPSRTPDHWGGGGLQNARQHTAHKTRRFQLPGKTVEIKTEVTAGRYSGLLDRARRCSWARRMIGVRSPPHSIHATRSRFGPADGSGQYWGSLPDRAGSAGRAGAGSNFPRHHGFVAGRDAQFAVLLDESALEVRHWNNDGTIEDVATGTPQARSAPTASAMDWSAAATPSS